MCNFFTILCLKFHDSCPIYAMLNFSVYHGHKFLILHSVEMLNLTRFIKNRLFSIMVNTVFSLLSADCVNIEFTHLNLFQNNHRHLCQVPLLGFPCCHTFHSAFANMHLMDCKFSVSTKSSHFFHSHFLLCFWHKFHKLFIHRSTRWAEARPKKRNSAHLFRLHF